MGHTDLDIPSLLRGRDLVSFDIFGTLVQRCIDSRDAFYECVERRARLEGTVFEGSFSKLRIESESLAIKRCGSEGLSIEDIYSVIAEKIGQSDADALRACEELAEIDLCFPISSMVDVLNTCVGKIRVVLVSDMYLHKDTIERILLRCGVTGYESLYVSSECGCNKESGDLFDIVFAQEDVAPSKFLHIGDAFSSDYQVPRAKGAGSLLVRDGSIVRHALLAAACPKSPHQRLVYEPFRDRACFPDQIHGDAKRAGLSVLGPLLYSFSLWLNEMKSRCGIDKLLFLSRDGYVMKKAYDLVFPSDSTVYMYGSRRAMVVPTLWMSPSLQDVVASLGFTETASIGEFLDRIGVRHQTVADKLAAHKLKLSDAVSMLELRQDEPFVQFFNDIQGIMCSNSREEFATYSLYLKSVLDSGSRCGLVDIGWRGNMQRGLCRALGEIDDLSCDIVGLYLGIYPAYNRGDEYEMHAFVFDGSVDQEHLDKEQCYNNLLESLFFAPHGTVEGFSLDGSGSPVPRLGAYEYDAESHHFFMELQDAALRYVLTAASRNLGLYLSFDRSFVLELVERLGMSPSKSEACAFGDCVTDYQGTPEYLAKARSLRHYLLHPGDFLADISHCWWKPGFLVRVFGSWFPWGNAFYRLKRALRGPGFDTWGAHLGESKD